MISVRVADQIQKIFYNTVETQSQYQDFGWIAWLKVFGFDVKNTSAYNVRKQVLSLQVPYFISSVSKSAADRSSLVVVVLSHLTYKIVTWILR